MNKPTIYWIDLFCGAGGTTSGIHMADANAEVVACVNHDKNAIESHKTNHPDCLHFTEDVRDFRVVQRLKILVDKLREETPGCIINLWASLECTNYSKAKGGLPRDADSRTLANSLFMYLEELSPDYIYIENVREFMAWGPLDKNGKPISRKNGKDYIIWINKMQSYGYDFEHKILNAANFGAYTSRERYFGQFAKKGLPICWPQPTHVKTLPKEDGFFKSVKKKWKAVREVLDLKDQGRSIFIRKKPLSENTLKRIYAGLIKFVASGEETFIKRYNGGNPSEKVKSTHEPIGTIATSNRHAVVSTSFLKKYYSGRPEGKVISVDGPAGTITTIDGHALVNANFLQSYYGNGSTHSIDEPCPTVTTKDRFSNVEAQFFTNYYSGGGQHSSVENPCPTITGVPKQRLTSLEFIDQQYGQSKPKSIEEPANTLTANPKQNLVAVCKHHYLMNPQFNSKGSSIEQPSPTIIARQDKKPLYVVSCEESKDFGVIIYEDDSETMIKIKEFMVLYGIVDIKMRMLRIDELLRIQGFPEGYTLKGTKTNQKKQIGNAVEVHQAMALIESNYKSLENHLKIAV